MSDSVSRRQFIRGAGVIGTATVGGIGTASPAAAQNETDDGQSCDPEESVECSYGGEPDYGLSNLVGQVKDHFSGADEENLNDALDDQYLNRIEDIAVEIERSNQDVVAAYTNLSDGLTHKAFYEATPVIAEGLESGDSKAQIRSDATAVVDEMFVTSQKNLIDRVTVNFNRLKSWFEETSNRGLADEFVGDMVWTAYQDGMPDPFTADLSGGYSGSTFETQSSQLVDGSTYDVPKIHFDTANNGVDLEVAVTDADYTSDGRITSELEYRGHKISNTRVLQSAFDALLDAYTSAINEVETLSNKAYDAYDAGELDLDKFVETTALVGSAPDDAETPLASQSLISLGIPTSEGLQTTIRLLNDDVILDGKLYLTEQTIGSVSVGETYRPADSGSGDGTQIDGLIYFAARQNGDEQLVRITQPFEVVDAIGEDGETLDEIGFTGNESGQERVDYNVTEVINRIEDIERRRQENEDAIREAAGAGGFDWSALGIAGIPGELVAVGGAIAGGFIIFGGSS